MYLPHLPTLVVDHRARVAVPTCLHHHPTRAVDHRVRVAVVQPIQVLAHPVEAWADHIQVLARPVAVQVQDRWVEPVVCQEEARRHQERMLMVS